MKKGMSKAIAFMLSVALILTGFTNLAFAAWAIPTEGVEESLGVSTACEGHTLGTFNGVPACVNENGDLHVCENNFPDENFRNSISEPTIYTDGYLSEHEVGITRQIDVSNREIESLQGVEFFTSLSSLICPNNRLSKLDVRNIESLWELNCSYNLLDELDISNNTNLNILDCSNNQLTYLNTSNQYNLKDLNCSYNLITNLDLSANELLRGLVCSGNQLTDLDVSHLSDLKTLSCENNYLSNLDVSKNDKLSHLECTNNLLTELDIGNNILLTFLSCASNKLTHLNTSKQQNLTSLNCGYNDIIQLDVGQNICLTRLYCHYNHLAELNLTNNPLLTDCLFDSQKLLLEMNAEGNLWTADMNKLVSRSNFDRITSVSQGDFDAEAGIITFDNKPTTFTYTYDVGKDDKTMTVSVNLIDHVHTFSDWQERTPATCTEKGEEYRTCACGEEETREITALGHSFTNYVSDNNATCTENGTETAKCDRCDATNTRTIENSALGHDYSEEWTIDKEATCTQPGSKSHHCTRCRDKADITEIPAAGHSFGEWFVEKPASMTEDGLEVRICSVCKEREEKILPAGEYLPGDVDNNGKVDDKDATYLLMHIFYPEDYPVRQDCDFNHDGEITDEDASYLLYYTFFPDDYPLIKQ